MAISKRNIKRYFEMTTKQLIVKCKKMPKPSNSVEISQAEFDSVLRNPDLIVVEKHFHNHLETNQVLFVIKNNEIDYVCVKEIIGSTTRIYKEV